MTDQAVSFLKEFVTKPHEIGAIVPSSEALARTLVESIDWSDVRVLAEYGPGLGAVTAEILGHVFGKDFFAIELNETYADAFSRRFPAIPLYRDSAANVVSIARAHGVREIDCVVSGLPWANFSSKVQDDLLEAMMEVLSPRGQFATFAYMHGLALPTGRKFRANLMRRFTTVERSAIVWRNTPPAVVYHCRR